MINLYELNLNNYLLIIFIKLRKMMRFEKRINYLLLMKYKTNERIFNMNIIDNIIFNEKSHLVTLYKEYLIMQDDFEFLKRYYNNEESNIRIKKYTDYYNKYSLLYPNYSPLPEAVIFYKNINLKQKVIDDMQISNKIEYKYNIDEIDNLDSVIFNSKVYDSIINNSENCLSLFSYDKESINSGNRDEGINKIVGFFDKIDFNIKNQKENKKEVNQLKGKLEIDINNINNTNYNKIYRRKITQNNKIYSKNNNISHNFTKKSKNQFKNDKEEKNKLFYKTINESGSFLVNNKKRGIYKKIKLNFLNNSAKKSNHTSTSFKGLSRDNSFITTINTNKNNIKNSINFASLKDEKNNKSQILAKKTSNIPIKINMFNKKNPIKVNTKKIKSKNYNNNSNKKKENNPKINKQKLFINVNKFSNFSQTQRINSESFFNKIHNLKNKNIKNANNNSNNNSNKKEKLKTIYKLINSNKVIRMNKSNSNNSFKKNIINLTKKGNYTTHQYNYIINNYNNKSTTYNTSIQFNNNIKIINSNDNCINIIKSVYENTPFNQSNNISDFIRKTPYEKKIIENKSYNTLNKKAKKYYLYDNLLNNKNYFSSIIDNKRKNIFPKKEDDFSKKKKNSVNSISKKGTSICDTNTEGISTPFIKRNNKIFKKINLKINNYSVDQRNKTIENNKIKKYKNLKNESGKIKDNQNKNFILQNKYLNITNTSLNNLTCDKNHSFLNSKIESNRNIYEHYAKIKKDKTNKLSNNKVKKDKNFTFCMNSNNINENAIKKINKKKSVENIKYNKEKKIKKIMAETNEKINRYKLNFLKKIENKFKNPKIHKKTNI